MVICEASFWQLFWDQLVQTSALEWLGTTTGFLCVYLAAKQHILNWPVSIISVAAYAILFYDYKLYGDTVLQLYFFGTAVYGWYYWIKRKEEHQEPVVSLGKRGYAAVIISIILLSYILGLFLDHYTNSDVPYIDGACTAVSFTAQFLMTRKVLQNWILWIIVDACYVPLYIYKQLALTAILYLLFLILATIGYIDWRKSWKTATI